MRFHNATNLQHISHSLHLTSWSMKWNQSLAVEGHWLDHSISYKLGTLRLHYVILKLSMNSKNRRKRRSRGVSCTLRYHDVICILHGDFKRFYDEKSV